MMIKIALMVVAGFVLPYNLLLGFGYTSSGALTGTVSIWLILFVLYIANRSGVLGSLASAGGKDEEEEIDDGKRLL